MLDDYFRIMEEQADALDFTILAVSIAGGPVLCWKKIRGCFISLLILLFWGFLFPLWSAGREVDRNLAANGPAMDNFELYYTYLIFKPYWLLMLFLLIVVNIRIPFASKHLEDERRL